MASPRVDSSRAYDAESVVLTDMIKESERWSDPAKRWPELQTDSDRANSEQFYIRCLACYRDSEHKRVHSARPVVPYVDLFTDELSPDGSDPGTFTEQVSSRMRRIKSAPIVGDRSRPKSASAVESYEAERFEKQPNTARAVLSSFEGPISSRSPPYSAVTDRTYFDADCVDLPQCEYKYALPASCKDLKLKSIAERQEDWRQSLPNGAFRKLNASDCALMDRVLELERLTLKTVRAETMQRDLARSKSVTPQKAVSNCASSSASPSQVGSNCSKSCLQPYCAGDCANKRVKRRVQHHQTSSLAAASEDGRETRRSKGNGTKRSRSMEKRASNEDKRADNGAETARKVEFREVADLLLSPPGNERHSAYYFFARTSKPSTRNQIAPKSDSVCSGCVEPRNQSAKSNLVSQQLTLGLPQICAPTVSYAANSKLAVTNRKALKLFLPAVSADYSSPTSMLMPLVVDRKALTARPSTSNVLGRTWVTESALRRGRAAIVFGGRGKPNFPLDTKYLSRRNLTEPLAISRVRSFLHLNIK